MAYSPTLGRWMQEDPSGYVDGTNMFEFVESAPLGSTDPLGLWKTDGSPWTAERATVIAEPGDTLSGLAERITGNKNVPKEKDRALQGGEIFDVRPLVDHLRRDFESRIHDNAKAFSAGFGGGRGAAVDAKTLRKRFFDKTAGDADCLTAVEAIIRKTIADIFGDTRYDKLLGLVDQPNLPYVKADGERRPGDRIRFINAQPPMGDAYDLEATICVGVQLFAHPFKFVTDATVINELTKHYNEMVDKRNAQNPNRQMKKVADLPEADRPRILSQTRLDVYALAERMFGL